MARQSVNMKQAGRMRTCLEVPEGGQHEDRYVGVTSRRSSGRRGATSTTGREFSSESVTTHPGRDSCATNWAFLSNARVLGRFFRDDFLSSPREKDSILRCRLFALPGEAFFWFLEIAKSYPEFFN